MSSASDSQDAEAPSESEQDSPRPPTRPSSRRHSRPPHSPRKRRRLGSVGPSQLRRYSLEGKSKDAYRLLYNEDVHHAAARFAANSHWQHYTTQIGASTWSPEEQARFFTALERLGRDNIPGIAEAIGTKSLPETQELLLLLQDAAAKQGDAKVTLRDIPAAVEIGAECNEQLDLAGEALAWFQEIFEASQEQDRFGDYWLITPAVASDIDHAVAGRFPLVVSAPASEQEGPPRASTVNAGSCVSCKQLKQKCDRGSPCGNCLRRKITACVYKQKPDKSGAHKNANSPILSDHDTEQFKILDSIPEAVLLDAGTMLTLSKTLFMNRSPTIPSPWPHWSEYTSGFADEPSLYRSAFNDLHALVISVTRRLVQTVIMQATSRLRSQRRRARKGILPLIKRRDVLAAITTVGLKWNGRERWRGVARRCSVRVFEGRQDYHQIGKHRREIPWDQVEQLLACSEPSYEFVTTEAETSENGGEAFTARAARSGTPLPIDHLALSDSDEEFDNLEVDSVELLVDETRPFRTPPVSQFLGRYTSVPLVTAPVEHDVPLSTIEQFDQEASRQEEQVLWGLLGSEAYVKDGGAKSSKEMAEGDMECGENVITNDDSWRRWTDYRAEWDEFQTRVPAARFLASQKPRGPTSVTHASHSGINASDFDDDTDISATEYSRRIEGKASEIIELRARSTRAYAALQEKAFMPDEQDQVQGRYSSEGDDADADVPTRSIDGNGQMLDSTVSEGEMSWEA